MWLRFNPAKDALFLDIDGTLLDIAPTAQEVVVSPQLVKDLKRLHTKLDGALAFISGRMINEIDDLFAPLRLPCSGAHGAEWRLSPDGPIKTSRPLPHGLRDDIAVSFRGKEGIFVEDKAFNVAVHYRQAPDQAGFIEKTLTLILKGTEEEVKLIRGRKVFEVTLSIHGKGQALERLLASRLFKNRRPVFLGDDTMDISAIGACMRNGGVAVRVGQGNPKQKSAFESPKQVRAWVNRLAAEKS